MRAVELVAGLAVAAASTLGAAANAATFQIVNLDGAGEGFNDPTPRAPTAGNPGVTLGQQRLNVFNAAGAIWGASLKSNVTIRVAARFNPLFCDPTSALLGFAGPLSHFRDFSGAPVASTWYAVATANSRHASDLDPGVDDITAQFNTNLDGGACLGGATWWYGITAPPVGNTVDLLTTVLHELAHGVGFLTIYDHASGAKAQGFDDAYLRLLRDETVGLSWSAMTNGQRLASQLNTGNLTWTGANVTSTVPGFNAGTNTGRLRMYAPNPYEDGSSVAHFDTTVSPNELMEPILTSNAEDYATYRLLQDVGWLMKMIFKDGFESADRDFW